MSTSQRSFQTAERRTPESRLDEHGNISSCTQYFNGFGLGTETRVLDIGARFGSFLSNLHAGGYGRVHGIDIDESLVALGKQTYPDLASRMQVYDGRNIPFPADHFQVVTMFDVLEHIPAVEIFLKDEVFRVLEPGGLLVLQTPNKLINVPWEILNKRSLTHWRECHPSLQTFHSLKRLLDRTGFVDTHIEKHTIRTPHNVAKTRRVFGPVGPLLLKLAEGFPLGLYPNFWGHCRKRP